MQSGKGKGQKFLWQAIPSMAICVRLLCSQYRCPPSGGSGTLQQARVQQVTCTIRLPAASARSLAAMLHSLSSVNAGLKVKAGLAA